MPLEVHETALISAGESDAAAEAFREGLGLVAEIPKPAIPHLAPDAQ